MINLLLELTLIGCVIMSLGSMTFPIGTPWLWPMTARASWCTLLFFSVHLFSAIPLHFCVHCLQQIRIKTWPEYSRRNKAQGNGAGSRVTGSCKAGSDLKAGVPENGCSSVPVITLVDLDANPREPVHYLIKGGEGHL